MSDQSPSETPRTDAAEAENRTNYDAHKLHGWPSFSLAAGGGYNLARDLEKQLSKAEAHIARLQNTHKVSLSALKKAFVVLEDEAIRRGDNDSVYTRTSQAIPAMQAVEAAIRSAAASLKTEN